MTMIHDVLMYVIYVIELTCYKSWMTYEIEYRITVLFDLVPWIRFDDDYR